MKPLRALVAGIAPLAANGRRVGRGAALALGAAETRPLNGTQAIAGHPCTPD